MTAPPGNRPHHRTTTALGTIRLLRESFWWRALLLVLAFTTVCIMLGRWQYSRHAAKVARNSHITATYEQAPVPLTELLATASAQPSPAVEWRRVKVTGTYETGHTVLIRNRPLESVFGYEVVVPLRLPDGALLLVDRGWIPNGPTGQRPASVPAAPSGPVEVVARLRPSETAPDRQPPPGQALRLDVHRIAAGLDGPAYQAYAILAEETPRPSTAPRPLPKPDLDLGNHFAYAVQWWIFAAGAVVLLGYYAQREGRRRAAGAPVGSPPVPARPAESRPTRGSGVGGSGARGSVRAKRRRVLFEFDTEAEDE